MNFFLVWSYCLYSSIFVDYWLLLVPLHGLSLFLCIFRNCLLLVLLLLFIDLFTLFIAIYVYHCSLIYFYCLLLFNYLFIFGFGLFSFLIRYLCCYECFIYTAFHLLFLTQYRNSIYLVCIHHIICSFISYCWCLLIQIWGDFRTLWSNKKNPWNNLLAGSYLFKVNNRNSRTRCKVCASEVNLISLFFTLNIFHTLF